MTNVSDGFPTDNNPNGIFTERQESGVYLKDRNYVENYIILSYNAIRDKLLIVFMSFLLVFSVLVNSMCLVVLCRRAFLMNVYAFGQRFLSVMDIAYALVVTLGYLIQGMMGDDLSDWNSTACAAFRTSAFILAAVSNWTIVYLSAVRYIGIKEPLKLHSNLYLKGAYASLVVISFVNSLFYVTFYLNLNSFIVVKEASIDTVGFCYEYDLNEINIYVVKCFLILPETILPGICIIILNSQIYAGFAEIADQAALLKRRLTRQSILISKLRTSLNIEDEVARQSLLETDDENRVSISLSNVSTTSMTKNYTKFFSRTMKRLSSITQTVSSSGTQGSGGRAARGDSKKIRRAKQRLLLEKQQFRRASITYGLLCAGVIPKNGIRKKSFCETESNVQNTPIADSARKVWSICLPCLTLASPFARKLIIVGTLSYILLNAPYCIWFIFSDAMFSHRQIDLAGNRLVGAIAVILKCGFHASNCVVYILSSTKVRSEVTALVNKFRCRQ